MTFPSSMSSSMSSSSSSSWVFTMATALLLLLSTPNHQVNGQLKVSGIQSDPTGASSYAGGMYYDETTNQVFLTGATYTRAPFTSSDTAGQTADTEPSCFVASVNLNDMTSWSMAQVYGDAGMLETCNALDYIDGNIVVVGNSEKNALFSNGETMSGFVMLLNTDTLDIIEGQSISTSEPSNRYAYPYRVLADTVNDVVYLLSLTSADPTFTDQQQSITSNTLFPNWVEIPKYGSTFDMIVTKLTVDHGDGGGGGEVVMGIPQGGNDDMSFGKAWTQEFPVSPNDKGEVPRVYIGGMMLKDDAYLVVVGSTRGEGRGYGFGEYDDEDGYMTVLDVSDGELVSANNGDNGQGSQVNQMRIGTAEDDIITSVCDDPNDVDSFYVVGATKGIMPDAILDSNVGDSIPPGSIQAFVSKINLKTLTEVWTVQWGAIYADQLDGTGSATSAISLGCAVANDNTNTLYVVGMVEKGATIVHQQQTGKSSGGDDLFATLLDTSDGNVEWMEQFGTAGNDHLARHGGVKTDSNGDLLIYGHTTGDLFSSTTTLDDDTTDVYFLRLEKVGGSGSSSGTTPVPVTTPTDPPVTVDAPTVPPTLPPVNPVPPPTPVPHVFQMIGTQLEGPMYAGGLLYDPETNAALISGATYGALKKDGTATGTTSACLLGVVDLDNGMMTQQQEFGQTATDETCAAIAYSGREDMAFLVGTTDENGYMVQAAGAIDTPALTYGMILQVKPADVSQVAAAINSHARVNAPLAVVTDPSNDYIYVASMSTDQPSGGDTPGGAFPDWIDNLKHGNTFFAAVQRYRVTTLNGVKAPNAEDGLGLEEDWYKEFATSDDTDALVYGITVAGNGGTLVVVGSTKGSGDAFGTNSGSDMDGFILQLDPATGLLLDESAGKGRGFSRLDSIDSQDDWVLNVCNDRFDNDAFYVVGMTEGFIHTLPEDQQPPAGTFHAFIAKIHANDLNPEWVKHFPLDTPDGQAGLASATGCAVTNQGEGINIVYITGHVANGGVLRDADVDQSHGQTDIFVVAMDGQNGDIKWTKQIGTEGDDTVQNDGIDVDSTGNVIILGQTNGNMYAERKDYATDEVYDLVVFTLNKENGEYKLPISRGGPAPTLPPPADKPAEKPDINEGGAVSSGSSVGLDHVVAIQTGPDVGPTYAGGMAYDSFTNSLYLTGATYGAFGQDGVIPSQSSCFFASLGVTTLDWNERRTYGTDAPEACNSLGLTSHNNQHTAIVVGSTEQGGLLTELGTTLNGLQFGFALELAAVNGKHVLQGGALLDGNAVQFPITTVIDANNRVYTISMVSKDTKVTPDFEKVRADEYPNLTTGGIEKFGSQYSIVVERHSMTRTATADVEGVMQKTLELDWRRPFETADMQSVFVSGAVIVGSGRDLVVVGSTRGREESNAMDGIMAKINPEDGSFQPDSGEGSRSVAYFASVEDRDDWILNACTDPDDAEVFYIVGATQGRIEDAQVEGAKDRAGKDVTVHAVVAKINVVTLTAVWTKQIPVKHSNGKVRKPAAAVAYGCDVIPRTGEMYIAGTVENDATLDYASITSAGGDDIFVGKMTTNEGGIQWMKQIGSNGDDRLAHGGGVKADANGNAVVYGDTTGTFYRSRNDDPNPDFADIFLIIVDKDTGTYLAPLQGPKMTGKKPETPKEWYPDASDTSASTTTQNSNVKSVSFAIVAIILVVLAIGFVWSYRRAERKRIESQKSSIFAYLQQFDVEDIDLRKSPPGGWHGTYLNKLAYGVNTVDTGGGHQASGSGKYETAPLTHSSVVRDSLFMDTTSTPTFGQPDSPDDALGFDSYEDLGNGNMYEDQKLIGKEVI